MQEEINSEILGLIPQRAPIVMVDRFLGLEDGISTTCLEVRADNIFCNDGCLNECGIIEHIAQSAAARVGHICRCEGREVPLGFIGAVNAFEASRLPRLGELITTKIEVLQQVFAVSLIRAESYVDGELVAGCKMKIFLQ